MSYFYISESFVAFLDLASSTIAGNDSIPATEFVAGVSSVLQTTVGDNANVVSKIEALSTISAQNIPTVVEIIAEAFDQIVSTYVDAELNKFVAALETTEGTLDFVKAKTAILSAAGVESVAAFENALGRDSLLWDQWAASCSGNSTISKADLALVVAAHAAQLSLPSAAAVAVYRAVATSRAQAILDVELSNTKTVDPFRVAAPGKELPPSDSETWTIGVRVLKAFPCKDSRVTAARRAVFSLPAEFNEKVALLAGASEESIDAVIKQVLDAKAAERVILPAYVAPPAPPAPKAPKGEAKPKAEKPAAAEKTAEAKPAAAEAKPVDAKLFEKHFKTVDIRIGEIVKGGLHPDGEGKLFLFEVECGDDKTETRDSTGSHLRQVVAGLAAHYASAELLVGKRVVVVCSLKPREVKGKLSEAMILCACSEDGTEVIALAPPADVAVGTKAIASATECATDAEASEKAKANGWKAVSEVLKTNGEGVVVIGGEAVSFSGKTVAAAPNKLVK